MKFNPQFLPIFLVLTVLLVYGLSLKPREKDSIKIDVWVKDATWYSYNRNGADSRRSGVVTKVEAFYTRQDVHKQYEDSGYPEYEYIFSILPEKMKSYRVKIYRNGKLCANSFREFEKNHNFEISFENTDQIICPTS
jgi:hypothetical protein